MLVRSDGPPVRPLLARHATPEAAPKPAKLTLWGEEAKSSPSLRTDCPLLAILVIQNCSAYVVVALRTGTRFSLALSIEVAYATSPSMMDTPSAHKEPITDGTSASVIYFRSPRQPRFSAFFLPLVISLWQLYPGEKARAPRGVFTCIVFSVGIFSSEG